MPDSLEPIRWANDAVEFLDQRALPHEEIRRRASTADEIVAAIQTLAVRGAPAIGIFGGYGIALLRRSIPNGAELDSAVRRVRDARPTAVNLAWAVDRVLAAADPLAEAEAIHREQRDVDERLCAAALELFPKRATVLTHCNTGPIATGGFGTALGAIVAAHRAGRHLEVYVGETRPLLQGARLSVYELARAGLQPTLLVDGAAALAMQRKNVDLVIVGADRIACNGDTANKIGTYALSIAAAHHGIPFYVAAPRSSFDLALESGAQIPIEERHADEVRAFAGTAAAGERTEVYNPAFDVTPGHLITAFVTEYGILRTPYAESVPALADRPNLAAFA